MTRQFGPFIAALIITSTAMLVDGDYGLLCIILWLLLRIDERNNDE